LPSFELELVKHKDQIIDIVVINRTPKSSTLIHSIEVFFLEPKEDKPDITDDRVFPYSSQVRFQGIIGRT
jgi:hypothetical protein